ncbi:unnamed protein product [Durusdinium trenchii]|uniref:Uncharacterized protein n=1 Tax=Durusdinium trenchii TaxID=1381693 RepID=A0ABP0QP43_9DINO
MLEDSSELTAQALTRLGYLDEDLNAVEAEAMFSFVNVRCNKHRLRKGGMLPHHSIRDASSQLRSAFLSHSFQGQWQNMTGDSNLLKSLQHVLKGAGVLSEAGGR